MPQGAQHPAPPSARRLGFRRGWRRRRRPLSQRRGQLLDPKRGKFRPLLRLISALALIVSPLFSSVGALLGGFEPLTPTAWAVPYSAKLADACSDIRSSTSSARNAAAACSARSSCSRTRRGSG